MNEYDSEPIRGLPERPPDGERILWQGAPDWRRLAWRAFFCRWVALYFSVLALWRLGGAIVDGEGFGAALGSMLGLAPAAAAAMGVLALMAWATAKGTVYTITNRRVVMRYGLALPMCVNIPFSAIGAAALRADQGDAGAVALQISGEDSFAYLALWPHVRSGSLKRAEPMLRALPDARTTARILAEALRAAQPDHAVENTAPADKRHTAASPTREPRPQRAPASVAAPRGA